MNNMLKEYAHELEARHGKLPLIRGDEARDNACCEQLPGCC